MTELPILLFLRAALILGAALLAVRLLARAPASLRYLVIATAFAAVLALPLIESLVPTWHTGALPTGVSELTVAPALPVAETVPVHAAAMHRVPAPATPETSFPWHAVPGILWLAGVALALLRVGVGAARARAIAGRAIAAPASAAPTIASAWRALGGRAPAPPVVVSGEIEAPVVIGAIAPVVVVPRDSADWSADRWRVVMLHELAHVRQRDGIANLIAQIACSVHWLNPLAWIAMLRLRYERELAADDAVLRAGSRASTYAEHLLAIASASTHRAPAAALAMVEPSRFESRVVALLDGDRARHRTGIARSLAIVIGVTAVACAAACVSPDAAAAPATPAARKAAAPPPTGDRALQAFADEELARVVAAHKASGAIAIVLDAKTGAPVVIATRGDADARAARTPGSTIKPFTFAAALEAGVVKPDSRFDCENGSRAYNDKMLRDASPNGTLELGAILAVSSNVCTAKVAEPLGDVLVDSLRRYGIPAPAHVDTKTLEGASIASGEGLQVSALEVATAYTVFANDGVAVGGARVMGEDTARTMRGLLERVITYAKGTGHAARIEGVRVAGKTGTAHTTGKTYYASFVGIVPADAPRFVVLVGVDGVTGSGGTVAAPAFAAIAARALAR